MTAAALVTRGLTKTYGARIVVDHLDLTVPTGRVFGFLGPNGAGKTTTIRMILDLARPTSGHIQVRDPGAVGYLPDVPGFHPWMRAEDVLDHAGRLAGLSATVRETRTSGLIDLAGLTGVDQPVGAYSRGMRQRLGLARALVTAPSLVVMDEPTSALDPLGRKDVLDLITTLRGRTTVLLSTHLLDDAERVCDEVAIIDHGRLLTQAPTATLLQGIKATSLNLVTADDAAALVPLLREQPWVQEATSEGCHVHLRTQDPDAAHREISGLVAQVGCGLVELGSTGHGLEEAFLGLVGGGGPPSPVGARRFRQSGSTALNGQEAPLSRGRGDEGDSDESR